MLDQSRKTVRLRVTAGLLYEARWRGSPGCILNMKDGLVLLDERLIRLTLIVLDALLVDGPLREIDDPWDDRSCVL